MSSFEELWDASKQFRRLFLFNGVFKTSRNYDIDRAELLWEDRYPSIEWCICEDEKCSVLVPDGGLCSRHSGGDVQKWAWMDGVLYCYMKTEIDSNGKMVSRGNDEWGYRDYGKLHSERVFGKIERWFDWGCLDGNPFNLRLENLAVLSKVAWRSVYSGLLTSSQAVLMDSYLVMFWNDVMKSKKPKNIFSYTLGDIARRAHVDVSIVRQEVSRGRLNPNDILSVADFCQRKNYGR